MKQCLNCFGFNPDSATHCFYCSTIHFKIISKTEIDKRYNIYPKKINIDGIDYTIDGLIGSGGCARIIKVHDTADNFYIIKVPFIFDEYFADCKDDRSLLIDESIQSINFEIAAFNKLLELPEYPDSIVKAFYCGNVYLEHDKKGIEFPLILMEYGEMSLGKLIQLEYNGDACISNTEKIKITREILQGLKILEDLSISHRDLSPDNFLAVGRGDRVQYVMSDFGSSKIWKDPLPDHDGDGELSSLMANLDFVDPKQYTSVYRNDKRCDIYSIGVILYNLFIGNHWPNLVRYDINYKKSGFCENFERDVFPRMVHLIDKPLAKIIRKCICDDIDKRFNMVSDLYVAFEKYFDKIENNFNDNKLKRLILFFYVKCSLPFNIINIKLNPIKWSGKIIHIIDMNDLNLMFGNKKIIHYKLKGTNIYKIAVSSNDPTTLRIYLNKPYLAKYQAVLARNKGDIVSSRFEVQIDYKNYLKDDR